jgi:hypothetical protein
MKTFIRTPKFVLLVVGIVSIVAMVFAQQKGSSSDPSKHGIRLIMGHKGNEALHCTQESLNRALSKCDAKAYKIKYDDGKGGKWEKGEMSDASVTMITSGPVDTGGAGAAGGVHSTQAVSFASTEDLKAFVSALDPAP